MRSVLIVLSLWQSDYLHTFLFFCWDAISAWWLSHLQSVRRRLPIFSESWCTCLPVSHFSCSRLASSFSLSFSIYLCTIPSRVPTPQFSQKGVSHPCPSICIAWPDLRVVVSVFYTFTCTNVSEFDFAS